MGLKLDQALQSWNCHHDTMLCGVEVNSVKASLLESKLRLQNRFQRNVFESLRSFVKIPIPNSVQLNG